MIGEIWTYQATKPNDGKIKTRPVFIIGNDANNQLQYVDIHYVIISSSADIGVYDVVLDEALAHTLGLSSKSVIKTTKLYTGARSKLGKKICDLPNDKKKEFLEKYKNYQTDLIERFYIEESDCVA